MIPKGPSRQYGQVKYGSVDNRRSLGKSESKQTIAAMDAKRSHRQRNHNSSTNVSVPEALKLPQITPGAASPFSQAMSPRANQVAEADNVLHLGKNVRQEHVTGARARPVPE